MPPRLQLPCSCVCTLQGQALTALGLEGEQLLLMYTMIDRHDCESEFAPFWASLPQGLNTGNALTQLLGFSDSKLLVKLAFSFPELPMETGVAAICRAQCHRC